MVDYGLAQLVAGAADEGRAEERIRERGVGREADGVQLAGEGALRDGDVGLAGAVLIGVYREDGVARRAQRVCERIRRGVESLMFCWEGMHHRIGVSIGALSVSNAVSNVSEILQIADAACFSAKERGRNNVYMVADDAPRVTEERRERHWAKRLATAIEGDEFLLFTQAIVPL